MTLSVDSKNIFRPQFPSCSHFCSRWTFKMLWDKAPMRKKQGNRMGVVPAAQNRGNWAISAIKNISQKNCFFWKNVSMISHGRPSLVLGIMWWHPHHKSCCLTRLQPTRLLWGPVNVFFSGRFRKSIPSKTGLSQIIFKVRLDKNGSKMKIGVEQIFFSK